MYVNDNFDAWHLGFRELVEQVRGGPGPGRALLDAIEPDPQHDYFVLKRMHSGFFAKTLILVGIAADSCVFLTASDAHMRGFEVVDPADCVACERQQRVLKADIWPSRELRLRAGADGGSVEAASPLPGASVLAGEGI